jgi:hypothetical protein
MIGPVGRAALAAGALVELASVRAIAQPFNVERPWVIGARPPGGARMTRIDASRRGLAGTPLPSSGLQTEWRTALGFTAQQGPLVDSKGRTYVVGESGEVIALARDGAVLSRVAARAARPGPPTLLSDDTLVFVDAVGEAVAVRDGAVIWRSRFGRASETPAAPIALDEGGIVVSSGPDLAVLNAGGRETTRIVLPEPTSHPLLVALGRVVIVSDTGAVWTWTPGAGQAVRAGSFGSDIDGSAALADDHTLVAVTTTHTRVSTFDLMRGTEAKVAGPVGGLWLGPPAVDARGGFYALQSTPGGEVAVAIDSFGTERGRALLAAPTRARSPDTGGSSTGNLSSTPPVIDAQGHLAFATEDGSIGIVSGLVTGLTLSVDGSAQNATVDLLAEACNRTPNRAHSQATVVGLAPLAPSGLVAVCRSGLVVAVKGRGLAGGSGAERL